MISLLDSELINKIFLSIAKLISFEVLPTPEKTIFLGLIPALRANINSPIDTTSAPSPNFFISFIKFKLVLDLIAKQINGEMDLKFFLKSFIFSLSCLYE